MVAYNDSLMEMFEDECHPLKELQEPNHNHNQRERQAKAAGGEITGIRGKVQKGKKTATGGKDQEEAGEIRRAQMVKNEAGVLQGTHQRWYLETLYSFVYGTKQQDFQHPQSSYFSGYHIGLPRGTTRDASPTYSPGKFRWSGSTSKLASSPSIPISLFKEWGRDRSSGAKLQTY